MDEEEVLTQQAEEQTTEEQVAAPETPVALTQADIEAATAKGVEAYVAKQEEAARAAEAAKAQAEKPIDPVAAALEAVDLREKLMDEAVPDGAPAALRVQFREEMKQYYKSAADLRTAQQYGHHKQLYAKVVGDAVLRGEYVPPAKDSLTTSVRTAAGEVPVANGMSAQLAELNRLTGENITEEDYRKYA